MVVKTFRSAISKTVLSTLETINCTVKCPVCLCKAKLDRWTFPNLQEGRSASENPSAALQHQRLLGGCTC